MKIWQFTFFIFSILEIWMEVKVTAFNTEYLCIKEEWWSILLERIKPHATILVQIHGYTDYSCQCNDPISPISKFELSKWYSLVMKTIVDKSMNKRCYSRGVNERIIVAIGGWVYCLVAGTVPILKWKIEGFLFE